MELIFDEPLLTYDDEMTLARAIEAGVVAAEALAGRFPHEADRNELREIVVAGRAAWSRFLAANLKLVAYVVDPRSGDRYDELFQEGVLGLMEALQRYDHRQGHRFSTFAMPWIRLRVRDASLTHCGAVGVPPWRFRAWRRVHQVRTSLTLGGRTPTVAQIAAEVGRSAESVRELLAWQPPVSLLGEGRPLALVARATNAAQDAGWAAALDCLSVEERRVIDLRYGFDDARARTRPETAELLGVSVATVRRREASALRRLRKRPELMDAAQAA